MRHLGRTSLSARAEARLARWQREVDSADPSQQARVSKLRWDRKSKARKTMEDVKSCLLGMTGGTDLCMYCEGNEGSDVDHFRPRSAFPSFAFRWDNWVHACSKCNGAKLAKFPLSPSGEPLYLNPTLDRHEDHLRFNSSGCVVPLTERGEASRDGFDLDRPYLQRYRKQAWQDFQDHIQRYDHALSQGDGLEARLRADRLKTDRHGGVLCSIVRLANDPLSGLLLQPATVQALTRRPEITAWARSTPSDLASA
jgi:uncharacterized protein (TIGR02646 family)